MYIYDLMFRETSTGNLVKQHTFVLAVKYTIRRPEKEKRININLPWSMWLRVKYSKDELPWPVADIQK